MLLVDHEGAELLRCCICMCLCVCFLLPWSPLVPLFAAAATTAAPATTVTSSACCCLLLGVAAWFPSLLFSVRIAVC